MLKKNLRILAMTSGIIAALSAGYSTASAATPRPACEKQICYAGYVCFMSTKQEGCQENGGGHCSAYDCPVE